MATTEIFGRTYADGTLLGMSVSAFQEVDPVSGEILDTTLSVRTVQEGDSAAAEKKVPHQGTLSPAAIFTDLDARLSASGLAGIACVWNAESLKGRERNGLLGRAMGLDAPGPVSTLHACWVRPGSAIAVGVASAKFPGGASVSCCGFADDGEVLAGDAATVRGWLRD